MSLVDTRRASTTSAPLLESLLARNAALAYRHVGDKVMGRLCDLCNPHSIPDVVRVQESLREDPGLKQ